MGNICLPNHIFLDFQDTPKVKEFFLLKEVLKDIDSL